MESVRMNINGNQETDDDADTLTFARSYQIEAFEKAKNENTIVYLETGSGKTLIAIMLLRSYAYILRKPSLFIAVFLVPKVVLVKQQADAVKMHTDLKVDMYWGEMGVDFWDAATWRQHIEKNEVLVMTPQILLNGLRHGFFKLNFIKVLIFDECHHAKGKAAYALIMQEFYHRHLQFGARDLPRIFGMTASLVKSKGPKSEESYWKEIHKLENMMCSKVYTCKSESVLAEFIPFSTPKFKSYNHDEIPDEIHAKLANQLTTSKEECGKRLKHMDLIDRTAEATNNKLSNLHSVFMYCLQKLGVRLAFKAAEILSHHGYEYDFLLPRRLSINGDNVIKEFGSAASTSFINYIRTATKSPNLSVGDNPKAEVEAGLLTEKVVCLVNSLLEYRHIKDIRCIVFVERIITAMVLESLLSELLPKYNDWKTKFIAGHSWNLGSQTRKTQNEIVQEFRDGKVNIIVATSILEEGLDVQNCNLVIRFDPSTTVSSFIQSRGRARMKNSDYLLLVKSGDESTYSKLQKFLASGEIMRKESLNHASVPCSQPNCESGDGEYYCVQSTNAKATLASSVSLIYFYCSRLPSDGYFKPSPRCILDKGTDICTLLLPKSCPIQAIRVEGPAKYLKQKACLEACKRLHEIGALNDNLVPDMIIEEALAQEVGNVPYDDQQQPIFFPPELVNQTSQTIYYRYLIELNQNFDHDILVHNVLLVTSIELDSDISTLNFNLEVDGGLLMVKFKYIGRIELQPDMVLLCRKFVINIFQVLRDKNFEKLKEMLSMVPNELGEREYFLLPCIRDSIDWNSVRSFLFSYEKIRLQDHKICPLNGDARTIETESGPVCKCMLQNSLVCTPRDGKIYCIRGISNDLDGCSRLRLKNGSFKSYKDYYKHQHGINLRFDHEHLLSGRKMFPLQNYLWKGRKPTGKDSENEYVQLPPELCRVIMSPISINTFYAFSFLPSIMHRLESVLIAVNFKNMFTDHCMQNVAIPSIKILEAITTKKCRENFDLESLETLGDSFLKYATCQQLFKTFQNQHEGLLSIKKAKLISNATLSKLGCERKLPGFIRNECFEPKNWMFPGDSSGCQSLTEEILTDSRKIYVSGRRKLKQKTVADAVEALLGAYVSSAGEVAGLIFLNWIGIKVEFLNIPYEQKFQVKTAELINVRHIESLLNYSFRDPSLLLEAFTHGSYMLAEIPRCYQRLEFLGDSVLDYLITVYMYEKYPGLSPGLLTDLRSASVNNDCYALCALRKGLHKHILHASQKLQKDIAFTVTNLEQLSSSWNFGWDLDICFPKVLGDVIESLAGAIFLDSGYNKDVVFESIRPLLEPLVTPGTLTLHPVTELTELCQKQQFNRKKSVVSRNNGMSCVTVEVEAFERVFDNTSEAADKKTAKRQASKEVLKALKNSIDWESSSTHQHKRLCRGI
ncbi:endoribonuclease Dicer homolog 2-like [Euphorbia lathyris]|uniref:endoribonuclease Dicer homolog 2-like n=1 Tax=Euphorbia lathyris TaxID=212925 RepID=UPI003313EFD2